MKVLIIAHSKENFNNCLYYLVNLEESGLKEIYYPEKEDKIFNQIYEKIKNREPVAESHSYQEYLEKVTELSKIYSYLQELEIDLATGEIV